MKILIVAPDINKSGGVANYYKILYGSFSHQVEYFTVGSRTDKDGMLKNVTRILGDFKRFKKKITENNYDLVVLNPTLDTKSVIRESRFIVLLKKYSSSKIIVFWRGFYLNFFDKHISGRFKKIFSKIYFSIDAHIVLGLIFKEKLLSIGCTNPIFCETTIVDNEFIKKDKKYISNDSVNILFLARVEKEKGIYEAINAFEIIKVKFDNAKLTIAGDGFELDKAKKYVDENKISNVFFLGDIRGQKKKAAFDNADIYLFPSYHEGMPNSVLEAMGMGLPIVTRNVGGLKDFFKDGEMGYITDSYNPQDFALLIEKLIVDIAAREKISVSNVQFAETNFLKDNVLKRLENIFETITKKES